MGYESNTGLGSRNFYGPRTANEGTEGGYTGLGGRRQLVMDISGKAINGNVFDVDLSALPANALVVGAFPTVTEAFSLGGTSPTIEIGTKGSEATNGVSVTQSQAQAVGSYDVTSTAGGTWAASLAAETQVSVALGGTSPTVTDAGRMRIVIEYVV